MTIQHVVVRESFAYVGAPEGTLCLMPVPPSDPNVPYATRDRCPVDGALLRVYVYADYPSGIMEGPEPAYVEHCPLCRMEWDV